MSIPKIGSACESLEIWNIFDNLKKEGEKCYQCIKIPLIKELIKIKDRKALVPLSYSGLLCICLN